MTIKPPTDGVRERTWTMAEYYRLGEQGYFHGQRVELIGGAILVHERMSPLRAGVLSLVVHRLNAEVGPAYHVRSRTPLDLAPDSEPEPGLQIVKGRPLDYWAAHPTHAVLLVEVSETTLAYDRGRKASLYASAGIRDYWIVNLVTPQVEVYRDPIPDAAEPFGHRYAQRTDRLVGDFVSPLALPGVTVPVADLLP